jgi:hypothetical protein
MRGEVSTKVVPTDGETGREGDRGDGEMGDGEGVGYPSPHPPVTPSPSQPVSPVSPSLPPLNP